jgi:hypothetical protein
MGADALISRLDRVKQTGAGRWRAICPGHGGKSLTLSAREIDDGRVLLRCFSGCSVEEILAAVGLTFDAIMPPRAIDHAVKGERRPFLPTDVFEIARSEIGVVAILACDMNAGRTISEADFERLFVASNRLSDIAGAAYGRK